jgi:hypothetical protein
MLPAISDSSGFSNLPIWQGGTSTRQIRRLGLAITGWPWCEAGERACERSALSSSSRSREREGIEGSPAVVPGVCVSERLSERPGRDVGKEGRNRAGRQGRYGEWIEMMSGSEQRRFRSSSGLFPLPAGLCLSLVRRFYLWDPRGCALLLLFLKKAPLYPWCPSRACFVPNSNDPEIPSVGEFR